MFALFCTLAHLFLFSFLFFFFLNRCSWLVFKSLARYKYLWSFPFRFFLFLFFTSFSFDSPSFFFLSPSCSVSLTLTRSLSALHFSSLLSAPMASLLDDVPDDSFVCPITCQVMEYPFSTATGHCYEHCAIEAWLKVNNTDPKTNQRLQNKSLIPNHGLRAAIESWFKEDFESRKHLHNAEARRPPPAAYQVHVDGLDQVIRYTGKRGGSSGKKKAEVSLPSSFVAYGHSYTFSSSSSSSSHGNEGSSENRQRPFVEIKCDQGPAVRMPNSCVFATPDGLTFYDPKEYLDARVLPGTDAATSCKFGNKCNRKNCRDAHPFVCQEGVECPAKARGCKFFHPSSADSGVTPVTPSRIACRYATTCTTNNCLFAHPKGRMTIPRVKAQLFTTHSHTLEELATPVPLKMDLLNDATTCFQMQGEYLCSFQPYPGAWARRHFKVVSVYRFEKGSKSYQHVGDYSLNHHYCNSAVVGGRYMVFSFWPYEEEAMRTIWGCLRVTRSIEKELRTKEKTCRELESQLEAQDKELRALDASFEQLEIQLETKSAQLQQAQRQANAAWKETRRARLEAKAARRETNSARFDAATARQEANSARQEAAIARRAAIESESKWRGVQQRLEREQNERFRVRDPIHIYALQEGKSGFHMNDWHLVLDYHKGAHGIQLGEPRPDGTQQVNFVVNSDVLQFDLVVPRDVTSLKVTLPLSPPVLCPDF